MGAHGGQQAGILLRQIGAQTEEHAEGGHHVLLGDEAGNGGHGGLPGAEAQGPENEAHRAADGRQQVSIAPGPSSGFGSVSLSYPSR